MLRCRYLRVNTWHLCLLRFAKRIILPCEAPILLRQGFAGYPVHIYPRLKLWFSAKQGKRNLLYVVLALLGFVGTASSYAGPGMPKKPPTVVEVVKVQQQSWQPTVAATGSLSAFDGTMLSSEVAGRVTKIYFSSGKYVKKGDLLLEIYPDIIKAQLKRAEAQLKESKLDYQRNVKLYKKGFVDQATLDRFQATLDSDQADVDNAEAQLGQHLIRAPFSGKIGLRKISLGDYVDPGQDLASLQSVDPMRVDFGVPQDYLTQVKVGDQVIVTSDALSKPYVGKIYAIDSKVNEQTRMLDMRAEIANPEHVLVPGTFVTITVKIKHARPVMVIPATTVVYSSGANYVYRMVKNKAVQTKVTLGKILKNNKIIVTKGLKPEDIVIIGGQVKLFNGSPVATKQEFQQMMVAKMAGKK